MQENILEEFIEIVDKKKPLHAKTLRKSLSEITDEEILKFENLINFYKIRENNTTEEIADKYLELISYLAEEQFYFFENERYRYSTFAETEKYYKDKSYMGSYTVGLGLSTYIWRVHREMMRFFEKYLQKYNTGNTYFEIGPGHGEYFVTAMQKTNFEKYIAVDISKESVELTQNYIDHSIKNNNKEYSVIQEDFFNYKNPELYDAVVMGEVLEHVENPVDFLQKIYQIADDNAGIFITTAINAPQPDHIYLFNNLKEVVTMVEDAGFEIVDYHAVNADNIPIEKAEKRKMPIVVGFIIRKNKNLAD